VIRHSLVDLCAEFAICLSICGARGPEFDDLVAALVRSQAADGAWSHPWYDGRQCRHATQMAVLALLEAGPGA
jgi:hypothetical protein